ARFLAEEQGEMGLLRWVPQQIQQPENLLPMWYSNNPSQIIIRTSGLYVISAGYRVESVPQGFIYITINGQTSSFVLQYGYGNNYINPTTTITSYLTAGDVVSIGGANRVINVLGTSQLSISQIPLISY
ncbi:MAG: hypothetical protein ABWZ79_18230, partial [Pedobacter agri]